ncbi:Endonuclease/exonuclease/phosphatase [Mycena rebaudengoi]|nr:Endonuclease/exonuclease/phosphatase [Mycena rebaudengoi]
MIVNIYSSPKGKGSRRRRTDIAQRLQRLRLPQDRPVIISGDINKYHSLWGIGDRAAAGATRMFVDWLQENEFTLQNEKGVPTYFEHSKRGAISTIDLTFTNVAATALDTTKEWAVDGSLASGSDHHALRFRCLEQDALRLGLGLCLVRLLVPSNRIQMPACAHLKTFRPKIMVYNNLKRAYHCKPMPIKPDVHQALKPCKLYSAVAGLDALKTVENIFFAFFVTVRAFKTARCPN